MKTKKNLLLPVLSSLLAFLLCGGGMLAERAVGTLDLSVICFGVCGFIVSLAGLFIREKWLYNAALPMYVLFIFCTVLVLFFPSDSYYAFGYRYIDLYSLRVSTLIFLPLTVCFIARLISKYKKFNLQWMGVILIFVGCIFCALILETHMHPLIICLISGVIVYIMMCKDRKLTGSAVNYFVVPVLCALMLAFFFCNAEAYVSERIMQLAGFIFDRETINDIWSRMLYDNVFSTAQLFGSSEYLDSLDSMTILWDSNILLLLVKYGWAFAIAVLVGITALLGLIWTMTVRIKNKPFSRYVALISASILTVQAVYSVVSLFFLTYAYIDLPFAGCSKSLNFISFILLMLIISCYKNKDNTENIKEEALYSANIVKRFLSVKTEENEAENVDSAA